MEVVPSKRLRAVSDQIHPLFIFFHRLVSGFLMAMNTSQSRPCRSDDPLFEPCPSLPESSSSPLWPPFHCREFFVEMSSRPCPPNHSTFFVLSAQRSTPLELSYRRRNLEFGRPHLQFSMCASQVTSHCAHSFVLHAFSELRSTECTYVEIM